jgi:hypothetical protein
VGGNGGGTRQRISALQRELASLQQELGSSDGQTDSGSLMTAPLGTHDALKCYKCGEMGHIVSECKSKKELRTCRVCKTVGHLANKCPQRHSGRPEEQGAGQSTASAVSANDTKPLPKNP